MRMWSMNIMILLLFCYACVSTSKGKVYFVSKNFFNVLHWDPLNKASPSENFHYTVHYRRHAEELHSVKECQNITALSCDLTAFTPTLHDVRYYAHVYANGRPLGFTKKFYPLTETHFSSPNLTIHTTATHLHVKVTLPLGPNGVSIADILKVGFPKVVFDYNLKITKPKWAAHEIRNNTSGQFNIALRSNQTYCGYVVYRPSVQWNHKSEKAEFCATLPSIPAGKPPIFLPWIVLGGVVLTVLIVLPAVCACIYMKGGKPKTPPHSLVASTGNQDILRFPDNNLVISKLVISESEKTVYAKILVNPISSSPGVVPYSPQEIPRPSWQDMVGSSSPTPDAGNKSSQFSEIYSSVAHNVPDEEKDEEVEQVEEDMETNHTPVAVSDESLDDNSRSLKPTSQHVSTVPDRSTVENNPDNQIILHTFRDTEGNLVFPSLGFESHGRTGDAESSLTAERKPLSSEHLNSNGGPLFASSKSSECSDSGCDDSTFNTPTDLFCNTNYFPATVYSPSMHLEPQSRLLGNGSLGTDYKPNWTLSVHHDPAEALNYPFAWNGDRMEDEVRGHEGNMEEEDVTEILLGNWKLQVQE
ncbi:interferon lambda receptor 1 [Gouania willdenowi]|uniref:Uncharacterized LOC114477404 n=1 Tax=Gouania willdenowi TaxID=441366 RepID=A0A8C5E9C0_GOUWI|nr:uncharacterized protein LOC114477404 [Gouania willdenowi]